MENIQRRFFLVMEHPETPEAPGMVFFVNGLTWEIQTLGANMGSQDTTYIVEDSIAEENKEGVVIRRKESEERITCWYANRE